MPAPLLATYVSLRAFWNESKPLRNWLWGKLPIVKDARKREAVEGHIAHLLDDANKLAQALSSDVLEDKITERVGQFKKELTKEGITGVEADALVERANLLVRLYVTGPLGDVIDLRVRLDIDEEALRSAEKTLEVLEQQVSDLQASTERLQAQNHRLTLLLAACATSSVVALLIALVTLVARR